ncbi:MAG TPA: hypothetical protein VF879_07650 [Nitrospirales bacterium]
MSVSCGSTQPPGLRLSSTATSPEEESRITRNDLLYGLAGDRLYTIEVATGEATYIGPTGGPFLIGMAYDSLHGIMYATEVGTFPGGLYTLDLSTGSSTHCHAIISDGV